MKIWNEPRNPMSIKNSFLVEGDTLHFALLLWTGDRCIEGRQQLKFVLDIISDCWISISYAMQWRQILQLYLKQAKVQKVPVASKNCLLVCHFWLVTFPSFRSLRWYMYIYIYIGCFSNTIGQNTTNGNGNLAQC